jgi:DNA modification methylase
MENQILIHGDCLEEMQSIPDGSIDAIICDPPYGTTSCQWDSIIPLEPMWEQLKRVIKKNGAIVLFGSQPFTSALIMSNMKMFKYCWVWEKEKPTNFMQLKKRTGKTVEDVCVWYSKQPTYNPQMVKYEGVPVRNKPQGNIGKLSSSAEQKVIPYKDNGLRYPCQVLRIGKVRNGKAVHPTQKPVALMEYLIKTYTNEGETVLDFTMGSGTTGVACQNLGRKFIGIEKDQHYYDIAKNRMGENLLKICEHNQQ